MDVGFYLKSNNTIPIPFAHNVAQVMYFYCTYTVSDSMNKLNMLWPPYGSPEPDSKKILSSSVLGIFKLPRLLRILSLWWTSVAV